MLGDRSELDRLQRLYNEAVDRWVAAIMGLKETQENIRIDERPHYRRDQRRWIPA